MLHTFFISSLNLVFFWCGFEKGGQGGGALEEKARLGTFEAKQTFFILFLFFHNISLFFGVFVKRWVRGGEEDRKRMGLTWCVFSV